MPYTTEELELITIVDSWIGQPHLSSQTSALLDEFPPSLKSAKEYFLLYIEYNKLRAEGFQLQGEVENIRFHYMSLQKEIPAEELKKLDDKRKQLEDKLKPLEKKINQFFAKPHEKNDELMQYLRFHYQCNCLFDDTGHLQVASMATRDEYWTKLDDQMKPLAKKFAPIEILRANVPSNFELRQEAYINGYKAGNLECKIQLANMYLNAQIHKINNLKEQDITPFDLKDQEVIAIIKEGVEKGMPSAIASMGQFLTNWMESASNPQKDRKAFEDAGQLALSLCSDKKIQEDIQTLLNYPEDGKPIKNFIQEAQQHVDTVAVKLTISDKQAIEMGRKLSAKSTSSSMDIYYAIAYLHTQGLGPVSYLGGNPVGVPNNWTAGNTINTIKPFLQHEGFIHALHNAIDIFLAQVISTNHKVFTEERLILMKGLCELINPKNPKLEQGIQNIQEILTKKHDPKQHKAMLNLLSNLRAENELSRNVSLISMNIDKQIEAYQPSDQNSEKITALEGTKEHLTSIFRLDSVSKKTTIALTLMENLKTNTEDLPTSNPLKRCINAVIKKLFNKDNFIKSQAYKIGQRGHNLLTQFNNNKHLQKSPKPTMQTVTGPLETTDPAKKPTSSAP